MRRIIISRSAKRDFGEIQTWVVEKFGKIHWNKIVDEWRENLQKIAGNPDLGRGIVELSGTGYEDYKKYLHKNVYAIYAFNATELRVHMFIPAMRDFGTHLMNRLLSVDRSNPQ